MLKLGVIGCGKRASHIVKLLTDSGSVRLCAIADKRGDELKKLVEEQGFTCVKYYNDAKEMLENEALDGVIIGTRCDSHTDYAELVASYSLPMFLEKPVCVVEKDLARLEALVKEMNDKTVVSFPLRVSNMLLKIKEIVDSGEIGKIEHIQAYNNVTYGRGYYHKWFREEAVTGGQFLQKATHDLDYINFLLGENKPIRICAMKSQQIFGGNEEAGKLCSECEKADQCPESPKNLKKNYLLINGDHCCFAKDVTIEDSGSVLVEYESGMHVVYSQNFVVRNSAGKRGARLIGFLGTLEFDWVSGKITVYRHFEHLNHEYTFPKGEGHFGGDEMLTENFISVMKGEKKSIAPLSEGILSARMCLAAKKSSEEHIFVDI